MDSVSLHSGEYVERFTKSPTFRVSRLVPLMGIGPDDRIADFGCGSGMLLRCLDKFGSYDGIDFSPDFIAVAKNAVRENVEFHCEDILEFCGRNQAAFDIATTLDFSEHIDDETFLELYGAIHHSLVNGGRLFIHTPNLDFIVERAKDIGILKQFPEHVAVRTGKQIEELLSRCGFRDIRIQTIPHYNVLKLLHPLSNLPNIGQLFGARLWIEAKAAK